MQRVIRLMLPRIGSMFFIYLVLIYIPDNIASRLVTGSVTALVFGWLFMQVPETLIGTALGTALLPTISEQYARDEKPVFRDSLNNGLRVMVALTLPVAVLTALGIEPLVGLLGFDQAGTELVVWTTRAFLVGLTGHAILEIAGRGFYAQQDAITPLWASASMAAVYTVMAIWWAGWLGAVGIALANSVAFTLQSLLLWYLLNRRYPGVARMDRTLLRAVVASICAAGVVLLSMFLPVSNILVTITALLLGGLAALPFIWPEVKILRRL
jgi:putative peptidoglycan lipid II flippase